MFTFVYYSILACTRYIYNVNVIVHMSNACELWDDVAGFEGVYAVSTHGRVFNLKRDAFLNPKADRWGSKRVNLTHDGMTVNVSVHELVAGTFIHTDDYSLDVNHINGISDDNHVDNLRWMTRGENIRCAKLMNM